MDTFCQKHKNCEAPISVIANLLTNNSPIKSNQVERDFNSLGFYKVKDLASATLGKVSQMPLPGDPLDKIYKAIQTFDTNYADNFKDATSEYELGNYSKAQELCFHLISYQPGDLNAFVLLSAAYFKMENYDDSLKCLNKANNINSKCAEVLMNIGSNYWKKSQYEAAMDHYLKALEYKSVFIDGWINLGDAVAKLNDKKTADIMYKQILIEDPKLYEVRNKRGKILLSLNNIKEAKNQYKIAKRDCPEFPDVWNNLGDVYLSADKLEKAILHYIKAVELDPNLITAWINLGLSYIKVNKYRNAVESLKKALELSPKNLFALEKLAFIYENYLNDIPLAIEIYKTCLIIQPNNFAYNKKMGLIYLQHEKNIEESEKFFTKCADINVKNTDVLNCLSKIYFAQGKIKRTAEVYMLLGDVYINQNEEEKAKLSYTASLYLNPDDADGHWKLGLVMHKLGHYDMALIRYRKSIELRPDFPCVYSDCGLIYELTNCPQKAIKYYEMALRLNPNHLNTLYNISNLELKLGHLDKAISYYQRILMNEVSVIESLDVHMKVADIFYKRMEDFNEALYHYEKALTYDNKFLDAYFNIASILHKMNKSDEALKYLISITRIDPNYVSAYANIGFIKEEGKYYSQAIEAYRKALEIDADFPFAYCNLVQCYQNICDWSDSEENYNVRINKLKDIIRQQLNDDTVPSLLPCNSLLYSFSLEEIKNIASKYAEETVKKLSMAKKSFKNYNYEKSSFDNIERIRVGYVFSDSRDHSVSQLLQFILNCHDKNNFELFYYSLSPISSSWSQIPTNSVHVKDISTQDTIDAANIINKDKINILINTNGYTKSARNEIFALKPAPIQVSLLGYPGTSGATFIDYLITDTICCPQDFKNFYTENLVFMKDSVFIGNHKQLYGDLQPRITKNSINNMNQNVNTLPMNNGNFHVANNIANSTTTTHDMHNVDMLDTSQQRYTRQLYNLPEDAIVYCNFGKQCKVDPSTFSLWMNILQNVPNSILWLLRFPVTSQNNLRRAAEDLNINTVRIIFSDLEPGQLRFMQIQLADIFLDTTICNSHTTCLDAIWAGLPVVTLLGDTFASRMTASKLTTLGSTFTVARDSKHYVDIATRLGKDANFLDSLKRTLWSLKDESRLFDHQLYVKELETMYSTMWKNFFNM